MKWFFLPTFFLVLWSSACHRGTDSTGPTIQIDTSLFTPPHHAGVISDPSLTEISGLAPSRQNPGYLWAEEDSGNPNQIQLIKPSGAIVGVYTLPGITNHDWEDIAIAAGPKHGQAYLYLAETGDNAAGAIKGSIYNLFNWSANKVIYRFAEPSIIGRKLPVAEPIATVDTITLTLPDGPRDSEAILIDPISNDIFILSKGTLCNVYQANYPQSLTAPVAMQHILTLPFKKVTSAAISPDGSEILIRTYKLLFYYKRQPGESILTALSRPPRRLPLAFEPQGESICWRWDGSGYYSTSELWQDLPQIIYFYQRKPKAVSDSVSVGE